MTSPSKLAAFQVPLTMHLLSGLVERFTPWWIRLGNLESAVLRDGLRRIKIDRPIYVAGIARAGTTIMLELLARHEEVATHRYRDFPGHFIPTWWNRRQSKRTSDPQERAHGDRLQVTEDSPEALEESLWMFFFPNIHDSEANNVLTRSAENPSFETFYRDHLCKLLQVRGRSRYVAKGNYNLTRFTYLQRLLPGARFIAVVRNPRDHIASLIRQQRLFCEGERAYPRALAHMRRVGHFEFGLDRRPISLGDGVAREVRELWQRGEEVRGTARYWASLYGWLADQLATDDRLCKSTLVIRYESLCDEPLGTIREILEHCELHPSQNINQFASQISAPSYYSQEFDEQEEAIIAEETAVVASRYGYAGALAR